MHGERCWELGDWVSDSWPLWTSGSIFGEGMGKGFPWAFSALSFLGILVFHRFSCHVCKFPSSHSVSTYELIIILFLREDFQNNSSLVLILRGQPQFPQLRPIKHAHHSVLNYPNPSPPPTTYFPKERNWGPRRSNDLLRVSQYRELDCSRQEAFCQPAVL